MHFVDWLVKTRRDGVELLSAALLTGTSYALLWMADAALFAGSPFSGAVVQYVYYWINVVTIGVCAGVCSFSGAYTILRAWLWFARA